MEQELKSKIDQACRTAEEFTKLYYESVDKRRHMISRLYLDTGIQVWNGNASIGKERIEKFFLGLPLSEHSLITLDAQPVVDEAVGSNVTLIILVCGSVKFHDSPAKPFQQNFMITAQDDKWKIVSDVFRLQEPIGSSDKPKS